MKNRLFGMLLVLLGMVAPVTSGAAKEIDLPARPSKSNIDIVTALEQRRTTVLLLVADLNKVPGGSAGDTKIYWAHSTAGTIAENAHLMAAARGVGTGIVAGIKVDDIRAALNLAKDAVPLYVMPLGYLK